MIGAEALHQPTHQRGGEASNSLRLVVVLIWLFPAMLRLLVW